MKPEKPRSRVTEGVSRGSSEMSIKDDHRPKFRILSSERVTYPYTCKRNIRKWDIMQKRTRISNSTRDHFFWLFPVFCPVGKYFTYEDVLYRDFIIARELHIKVWIDGFFSHYFRPS